MSATKVPQRVKDANRRLCDEYPFLIPSSRWSGNRITALDDDDAPEYDYEYTELDDMPEGWRIAFGNDLLRDLKAELVKSDRLEDYRVVQIKEKYGGLRWYDNGCTDKWYSEILPKYERLSYRTCIHCGKPATVISKGWIMPFCDDCAKEIIDKNKYYHGDWRQYYTPIAEFYGGEEDI